MTADEAILLAQILLSGLQVWLIWVLGQSRAQVMMITTPFLSLVDALEQISERFQLTDEEDMLVLYALVGTYEKALAEFAEKEEFDAEAVARALVGVKRRAWWVVNENQGYLREDHSA